MQKKHISPLQVTLAGGIIIAKLDFFCVLI